MIKEVKITEGMHWANVVEEIESTVEDTGMIVRVGSADGEYGMSWEDFKLVAWDIEYHLEGGFCALATDLVVVLNDGSWYEQDKSSGFFYHRWAPTKKLGKPFEKLVGQEFSIKELNTDDKADV